MIDNMIIIAICSAFLIGVAFVEFKDFVSNFLERRFDRRNENER